MKILFDHSNPFLLAHGGLQIQIEETKRALEGLGVSVEYMRWWDGEQNGDIIHFFGRPSGVYINLAHKKNIRVVMAELLTGLGSRSAIAISAQRQLIRVARKCISSTLTAKMGWEAYASADRIIALTDWEAELMRHVFDAPTERVTVVPNGVADEFLQGSEPNAEREAHLVCTATITERKRVLELAQAAEEVQVPIHFIGAPYSESDPYFLTFRKYVDQHQAFLKYIGAVNDRARLADIYRRARGFVLLSTKESLSLSALEAAACKCPVLLSDLPWARSVFGDKAVYCPITRTNQTARILRKFYDEAPALPRPPQPHSWMQIAQQLKEIYTELSRVRT